MNWILIIDILSKYVWFVLPYIFSNLFNNFRSNDEICINYCCFMSNLYFKTMQITTQVSSVFLEKIF